MNDDEKKLFCSTLLQISNKIWDIVCLIRTGKVCQEDINEGERLATDLQSRVNWYRDNQLTFVPETTIWLAGEVQDTLRDLSRRHSLTFK